MKGLSLLSVGGEEEERCSFPFLPPLCFVRSLLRERERDDDGGKNHEKRGLEEVIIFSPSTPPSTFFCRDLFNDKRVGTWA